MGDKSGYLLTIVLSGVITMTAQAGGIYKWRDADGNVHYSEKPPQQGATELHLRANGRIEDKGEVKPAKPQYDQKARRDKMIQALEGERLARQEEKAKQKKELQKKKMRCAQAKDTLRQYRSAASLYKLDTDGNRHTLPDSAKQAEIKRLESDISKWCK